MALELHASGLGQALVVDDDALGQPLDPLGLFGACRDDATDVAQEEPLAVTITASGTTVASDAPVTLTITIENTGDTALEWGSGSSTCRLFAGVTVDGEAFAVPAARLKYGTEPVVHDVVLQEDGD